MEGGNMHFHINHRHIISDKTCLNKWKVIDFLAHFLLCPGSDRRMYSINMKACIYIGSKCKVNEAAVCVAENLIS